ncbi:MAG: hypothetical protein AAF985_22810 [Bacteroidota bacterium]
MLRASLLYPREYGRSMDLFLLLLRLTFGGLMLLNHGWGKMLCLFGDEPIILVDPLEDKEMALLYLIPHIGLMLLGRGYYYLDFILRR